MSFESPMASKQAVLVLRTCIQDLLENIQEESKQAIDQSRFDQAQALIQQGKALKELLDDLVAWSERFDVLVASDDDSEDNATRLHKGLKTPQSTYRVPILRALVTLGGEAGLDAVLERVEAMVADQLNDHDRDTLSDGKAIRWRNTAQWARNSMREDGLIRGDTPRGVWGISDKGRQWLKEQT